MREKACYKHKKYSSYPKTSDWIYWRRSLGIQIYNYLECYIKKTVVIRILTIRYTYIGYLVKGKQSLNNQIIEHMDLGYLIHGQRLLDKLAAGIGHQIHGRIIIKKQDY